MVHDLFQDPAVLRADPVRREAMRQVDALMRLPEDRRVPHIHQCTRSLRTPPVVHELLRRSHEEGFRCYKESLHLAQLAIFVAGRISGNDPQVGCHYISWDCLALSVAQAANANRIGCHWSTAIDRMAYAHSLLEKGTGDPAVRARLCSLRASLRKDCQDYAGAAEDLEEARKLYRELREPTPLVGVLMQAATVYYELRDFNRALSAHQEIYRHLDERRQPILAAIATCNHSATLTDMGDPETGLRLFKILPTFEELGIPPGSTLYIYREWEVGRAKMGLGYYRTAKPHLLAAIDGFRSKEDPFNEALVGLDLACLYFFLHTTTRKFNSTAAAALRLLQAQEMTQRTSRSLIEMEQEARKRSLSFDQVLTTLQQFRRSVQPIDL